MKYVIKVWKKIENDFYSKDVICSNIQAVEAFIKDHPEISKIDLRIIREKNSDPNLF